MFGIHSSGACGVVHSLVREPYEVHQTVLRSVRGNLDGELANDFAGQGSVVFYNDNA